MVEARIRVATTREDTPIASRKRQQEEPGLDIIPPMTPVLFGPRKEPLEGFIHAVVIYQDYIRYKIVAWVDHEPVGFELPDTDFEVLPQEGPKPLRVGFTLNREQE